MPEGGLLALTVLQYVIGPGGEERFSFFLCACASHAQSYPLVFFSTAIFYNIHSFLAKKGYLCSNRLIVKTLKDKYRKCLNNICSVFEPNVF